MTPPPVTPPPDTASSSTLKLLAGNVAGAGNVDGTQENASLGNVCSATSDGTGNIYFLDPFGLSIRKLDVNGAITTTAKLSPPRAYDYTCDQPGTFARDSHGNFYAAGPYEIVKISPDGTGTRWAGSGQAGSADGIGTAAEFNGAAGIAFDPAGNLYVADSKNATIRKISPDGVVTTFAGTPGKSGDLDGTGSAATFSYPLMVATDTSGNVYVTDETHNRYDWWAPLTGSTVRKITPSGVVTTIAGSAWQTGNIDGKGTAARFGGHLQSMAVDPAGTVYAWDQSRMIRKITPSGEVSTIASAQDNFESLNPGSELDWLNGFARGEFATFTDGLVSTPRILVSDPLGNVHMLDNTLRVISPRGVITTRWSQIWGMYGFANGQTTSARFARPQGLAFDAAGNLYVADAGNNAIRKISATGVVTTVAGSPQVQGANDGSPGVASFHYPLGVAVDSKGTVFVADTGNCSVRKIATDGVTSTIGQSCPASTQAPVDGQGTEVRFAGPKALAVDANDNVYVADGNALIRKIAPTGKVTTLYIVSDLHAIAVSPDGTLYVTREGGVVTSGGSCGRVDKITSDGVHTTVFQDFCSDALLGITTDSLGNVYFANTFGNRIQKITPAGVVSTVVGQPGKQGFLPGALPGVLNRPKGLAMKGRTLYITMQNGVVAVENVP